MPELFTLALIVVALALLMHRLAGGSLERKVSGALQREDLAELQAHLTGLTPAARPVAYNQAIRRIWDAYQRPLAVPLILALARDCADEPIAQYWLQQLQSVEPELAAESLDPQFLATYYKAHVAASCGDTG